MNSEIVGKWLLIAALPVVVLVFFMTASAHFGYTPDDTFIYLQFAKNLIHGNGISFNAGEPSYGFTSPLWMFIIALGGRMGIDLLLAAKALDLVFASLALIAFYLVAYEIIRDASVSILTTVAFSVNAWMVRWAGSGMETSLSVFLVLLTIWFCLRNEYFVAVVFGALLTLVRPEAGLMLPLILIDVYVNSFNRKRALHHAAALVLVYVSLLTPWWVFAYSKFGTVIPNTASAKSGLMLRFDNLISTGADVAKTIATTDGVALAVLIIAGSMICLRTRRSRGEEGTDNRSFFLLRQSLIGMGWIIVLPLFYVVMDVNVVSRYLLLVTPLITIFAVSYVCELAREARGEKFAYIIVLVLVAMIMGQNQYVYRKYVEPGITAFSKGMETCLIPAAAWLRQHTPRDAKIVVGDVGAIGYYSDRTVCDAAGLVSPEFLPFLHDGNQPYDIIQKKLYREVCDVDYVIDRGDLPERLKDDPTLLPLFSRPFVGMTLDDSRITYYTIYKVVSH